MNGISWAEKELKKHKIHGLVEQAMRDPRFLEAQKKHIDDATRKAFDSFLLISVDYLYRKCGYKREQILAYLSFITEQLDFVQNDSEYFILLNEAIQEELGINILGGLENENTEFAP